MDKETEELADKYIREAGYNPDIVRGKVTQHEINRARSKRIWAWGNANKDADKRQVGLHPPKAKVSPNKSGSGIGGLIVAYFLGKMF